MARLQQTLRHAGGFIFLQLLGGLLIAAMLMGVIGYTYMSVAKSSTAAQLRTQSGNLLQQAAYILAAETNNAGAYPVTPGATQPLDGVIPTTSGAPKDDAWGTPIHYCTWANDGAGQASIVYAVISAGLDKTVDTTCADARAKHVHVMTGGALSDDKLVTMSVSQLVQGVGGTQYFGDPVSTIATLEALPTASVKKGQIRVVGSVAYINLTGAGGTIANGNWSSISSTVAPLATALNSIWTYPVTLPQNVVLSATNPATNDSSLVLFYPVKAAAGTGPYTYAITGTGLPAGLNLDTNTGIISGTPLTTTGTTTYTVMVTDTLLATSSKSFTMSVAAGVSATLVTASVSLVKDVVPTGGYIQPVTGAGGTAPRTYTLCTGTVNPCTTTSVTLPAGLTTAPDFSTTGKIYGTPTAITAAANYTVGVTDANSKNAVKTFSLAVTAVPAGTEIVGSWVYVPSATSGVYANRGNQCTSMSTHPMYSSGWQYLEAGHAGITLTTVGNPGWFWSEQTVTDGSICPTTGVNSAIRFYSTGINGSAPVLSPSGNCPLTGSNYSLCRHVYP